MGLKAVYLLDTSAIARMNNPKVAERLVPLLENGLAARCTFTDLEAGYSSQTPKSHLDMRELREGWPLAHTNQDTLNRAVEVQDMLAAKSQHRGVKLADLLIAAVAESNQLTVLHYDHDFDLIAQITSQPAEWIQPRGTIDRPPSHVLSRPRIRPGR